MAAPISQPQSGDEKLKIYFLPNLLTAGNLFCGFVALTKIVEANLDPSADGVVNWLPIKLALGFILLACIFDLFDGRVARPYWRRPHARASSRLDAGGGA